MNLFETYFKYFEHQAKNHPDILHTDASKAFELISVEEAFGDFRTIGKKGVIVRLLEFGFGLTIGSNTLRPMTGGFMILNYHSARLTGKEGFYEAIKQAEKVTDDIIHKMVHDSRNGHPLFGYSFNTAQNNNITMKLNSGDYAYSGFVCVFTITPSWEICFTDNPMSKAWAIDSGEHIQTEEEMDWVT